MVPSLDRRGFLLAAGVGVAITSLGEMTPALALQATGATQSMKPELRNVKACVPTILARWQLGSVNAKLKVSYRKGRITSARHDYQLDFSVENTGPARIAEYQLDVLFPNAFLEQTTPYTAEVTQRRTSTHRSFRSTERDHGSNPVIFPGDIKRLFVLDYFVDQSLHRNSVAMNQTFTATLRCGDEQPVSVEYPIRNFQIF
jgi:hypothetical protein